MLVGLDGAPLISQPRPVPNPVPVASFVWDRETPAAWREQLEQRFPRQPNVSWLELFWVAGTPAAAIQRWVVYEAMPAQFVSDAFREGIAYMLTHERAEDHTAEERRLLQYWTQHNALLRTFWIVQGPNGGHKYRYDRTESRMLELMGLPSDPPLPGDLPYAEFGDNVLEQLAKWDLLRKGHADLRAGRAAENQAALEDWRRQFIRWLHAQLTLENVYKDVDISGLPRTAEADPMSPERLAAIEEHYVKTGRILPVRTLS